MRQSSLPRARSSATSVPPVALLAPGVALVVVAEGLPEAWLVFGDQPQSSHPLGALPEVEVGDEQASRTAMLGLERLAAVGVSDPGLSACDLIQRQVRRVAAVAEGDDVLGSRFDLFQQGVHRDAFPTGTELRPFGNAVDVGGDLLRGQLSELLPHPSLWLVDLPDDGEVPFLERSAGRGAGREHRKSIDQVLSGWEMGLLFLLPAAIPKAPGKEPFTHVVYLLALRLYSSAPLVRAARLYDDASRFFSERRPEGQRRKPDPPLASGRLARYADRQGKRSSLMPALPTPSPRPPTQRRIQIRRYEGGPRPQPRRRGRSANGSAGRRSYARGCRAIVACQSRQALPAPATRTGSHYRRRSRAPLGTRALAHHRTAS